VWLGVRARVVLQLCERVDNNRVLAEEERAIVVDLVTVAVAIGLPYALEES
jgi:hypothetical protein